MPIIYYDGNCVYCYNYAIWLIQHGLLQEGDQLKYKSDAITTLITSLTNYKWLGILLRFVPNIIRDFGYQLFADNRNHMWKTHWHEPNDYEKSFFID